MMVAPPESYCLSNRYPFGHDSLSVEVQDGFDDLFEIHRCGRNGLSIKTQRLLCEVRDAP